MIAVNRFPFIMVREKQCLETYLHVISVSMIHLTYNTTALHSYKDNFAFMGAIGNPTQSPKQIAIYRKIISTYCVVCFAAYCMMQLDNVHRFFSFRFCWVIRLNEYNHRWPTPSPTVCTPKSVDVFHKLQLLSQPGGETELNGNDRSLLRTQVTNERRYTGFVAGLSREINFAQRYKSFETINSRRMGNSRGIDQPLAKYLVNCAELTRLTWYGMQTAMYRLIPTRTVTQIVDVWTMKINGNRWTRANW